MTGTTIIIVETDEDVDDNIDRNRGVTTMIPTQYSSQCTLLLSMFAQNTHDFLDRKKRKKKLYSFSNTIKIYCNCMNVIFKNLLNKYYVAVEQEVER